MERASGDRDAVLGVDIGGTFTDLYLRAGGSILSHKLLSTPEEFSAAVVSGVRAILVAARDSGELQAGERVPLRHGSTVATNAFLERKGARVALIVTAGFEDLLEIGRQSRPELYALDTERSAPLIAPGAEFGVTERVAASGEILTPLDTEQVEAVLDQIAAKGISSVAVSLLFSFACDAHEVEIGQRALKRGMSVALSSRIAPELREVERAATAVASAYVAPVVSDYLAALERDLEPLDASPLSVFGSAGTLMSVSAACERPVDTLLSGPAGGVMGAWRAAIEAGHASLIAYDMGGTSTDVSLATGEPSIAYTGDLDGIPLVMPRLDIHTVGAGGGSIAWIDPGGALKVGPRSAGAAPGPACYARGGAQPTTSDANLVLGRLRPDRFLGGRMKLSLELAQVAVGKLAQSLAQGVEETAEDIIAIANVAMARALRRISVERGHDTRDFTLVAFGGAGGLHAAALARELGISTVLVPRHPGVLSAAGMAHARLAAYRSVSVMLQLPERREEDEVFLREMEAHYLKLEREVSAALTAQGLPRREQHITRIAEMRYAGQSYELGVEAGDSRGARVKPADLMARFHAEHRTRFGYDVDDARIQVVTLRVRGVEPVPEVHAATMTLSSGDGAQAVLETVTARLGGKDQQTKVYERARLGIGDEIPGPAIVVEPFSTTLVPPEDRLIVDAHQNLQIEIEADRS